MIMDLSIAAASAAFVVLAVAGVLFLRRVQVTLEEANRTLALVRQDVESVSRDTSKLLAASTQLVQDVEEKLHTFDPLTRSVRQTGEALEQVSASVKQVTAAVSESAASLGHTVRRSQSRMNDWAEIASTGLQIWKSWQSHRQDQRSRETTTASTEKE